MQQISRPYQIALVVLVLAAATWLVAFGHHSSSGGGASASSTPSSSPSAPSQPAGGSANASSSSIYHGSAPGVEGLTKAIAKAHAAVGTSETNARQLQEKSAQASGEGSSAPATSAPSNSATTPATSAPKTSSTTPATSATKTSATTPAKPATHTHTSVQPSSKHVAAAPRTAAHAPTVTSVHVRPGAPVGQQEVEAAVATGKVALVLFWNPAGSNDRAVRSRVHSVGGGHSGVDVFEASAREVASFGAITRQLPVYGTPTILIIGSHRSDSLSGLQDTFSIEQAIREVRAG